MMANLNRPVKGGEYFVEAAPLIIEAVPEARFLVVGEGALIPALRERAQRLGVGDRIVFAGYRHDVDACYAAMDLSVLTSLSEGLSIALLESMRHGLSVVATRVGGNPELVLDGECGYLVPARDVEAFASRVIQLLRNPEERQRIGAAARRRVEEHFSLTRTAEQTQSLYESLTGRGPRKSTRIQSR